MAFKFSLLSLERTKDYTEENNMVKTNSQAKQREKFKKASKKCSGKKIKQFRSCMKKELEDKSSRRKND